MSKKYLRLLWNEFSFLFLSSLTACIIIGLGITFLNNSRGLPEVSVNSTSSNSETHVVPVPSDIEENLQSKLEKTFNLEEKLPSLPEAPPQQILTAEKENQQLSQTSKTPPQVEAYLGHFPYSENLQQNLVKVADFYGREEFLDRIVANAFYTMQAEAKMSGVDLTIISGFRSIAQQDQLFQKQINKRGSKEAAARLSAPPGYSEHHTGYALDIGEGDNIDTYIKFEFEYTEAYRWLVTNAYEYGFELSFPKDNSQGVSYEPWHWRFVGSPDAAGIFSNARKLSGVTKSSDETIRYQNIPASELEQRF